MTSKRSNDLRKIVYSEFPAKCMRKSPKTKAKTIYATFILVFFHTMKIHSNIGKAIENAQHIILTFKILKLYSNFK